MKSLHLILTALCLCLPPFAQGSESGKKNADAFPKPVIEKIEGWTIELDPTLKRKEHRKLLLDVRKAMANHLQRIVYILPPEKTKALRKLPIRIDLEHKLTNMQYHPSKQWLIANGHDPSLEKRVHVPRARNLLARGTWAKHPYVILHELAHGVEEDHEADAALQRRTARLVQGLHEVLGVNAVADEVNRLAVASEASLFSHDGAGHQVKVNKAAAGDTASLLFQTGWSGRAEMGTTGSDAFATDLLPAPEAHQRWPTRLPKSCASIDRPALAHLSHSTTALQPQTRAVLPRKPAIKAVLSVQQC